MTFSRTQFNLWRKGHRAQLVEKGLCSEACGRKLVLKWTCRECADKINQYARNYWLKNHEANLIRQRAHMHRYRFGGLRDLVLERDKKSCQVCLSDKRRIVVHHINENNKDNRMDNLVTLCYVCHIVVERMNRTKPKMHFIFPWLKDLKH